MTRPLLICLFWTAAVISAALPVGAALAQPVSADALDPMQEVTPEREAAALTFAGLHHPELAELLQGLKAGNHPGYDDAVRDLFKASERLARLKARLPDRYELELDLWKVDSRIRLLAARLAMEESPSLESQLRALLHQKTEARAALVRYDRDKTAVRLERLNSDLEQLTSRPEAAVDAEMARILRSARAAAPGRKNSRNNNRGGSVARPDGSQATPDSQPARLKQERSNRKTAPQQ